MTYSHAEWIAHHRATWLPIAQAEARFDATTDVAALIDFHTAGVAASFVAMSGRGAA